MKELVEEAKSDFKDLLDEEIKVMVLSNEMYRGYLCIYFDFNVKEEEMDLIKEKYFEVRKVF